jgi:hypothetical protein
VSRGVQKCGEMKNSRSLASDVLQALHTAGIDKFFPLKKALSKREIFTRSLFLNWKTHEHRSLYDLNVTCDLADAVSIFGLFFFLLFLYVIILHILAESAVGVQSIDLVRFCFLTQ